MKSTEVYILAVRQLSTRWVDLAAPWCTTSRRWCPVASACRLHSLPV